MPTDIDREKLIHQHGDRAPADGPVILVASNGSTRGHRAVGAAAQVARATGRQLLALHVLDEDAAAEDAEGAIHALEAVIEALGFDGPVRLRASGPGRHWDDAEAGRAHIVKDVADSLGASLVVLGPHDRARRGRSIRGSMTEQFLRESRCPVLIGARATPAPYLQAVVGTDMSAFATPCITAALTFAPQAEVDVIHAYEGLMAETLRNADFDRQEMERRQASLDALVGACIADLPDDRARPATGVLVGDPGLVISTRVADLRADLLVLGTHGRSMAMRLVFGSVAKRFVDQPPCDVLVIPKGAAGA